MDLTPAFVKQNITRFPWSSSLTIWNTIRVILVLYPPLNDINLHIMDIINYDCIIIDMWQVHNTITWHWLARSVDFSHTWAQYGREKTQSKEKSFTSRFINVQKTSIFIGLLAVFIIWKHAKLSNRISKHRSYPYQK